jgi:aspartyl/asparaginyl beta-hydroxylase (cupin superfamily)
MLLRWLWLILSKLIIPARALFIHQFPFSAMAVNVWATLALKWYTSELGSDSQEVINMKDILRNPELHYAWGSRQHMSVGRPSF